MPVRPVSWSVLLRASAMLTVMGALIAADGDPDPSFGTNGQVIDDLGPGLSYGATIRQPDGTLLFAGSLWNTTLSRYLPNGTRDLNYGTNGIATPRQTGDEFSGQLHYPPSNLLTQPDRSVIVAGTTFPGGFNPSQVFIARVTKEGYLDPAFGTDGRTVTTSPGDASSWALARQDDGKLVVAGFDTSLGRRAIQVLRYLPNGQLDGAFGTNGRVVTAPGNIADYPGDIITRPDGSIFVVGHSYYASNSSDLVVLKFRANGSLDPAFATAGILKSRFGAVSATGAAIVVDPRGRLVVGGYTNSSSAFLVARFLANGAVDTSFATNGASITAMGPMGSNVTSLACLADGRILAAGSAHIQVDTNSYGPAFAVLRLGANGLPDTSFGTNGRVLSTLGYSTAQLCDLMILPDGRFVCSGTILGSSGSQVALARYLANTAPYVELTAGDPSTNSIALTWTAPIDPATSGPVAGYQVRYSTSPITSATWASATPVTLPAGAQAPGATEQFTVPGLASATTYYFAYRYTTTGGSLGPVSRGAGATTLPLDATIPTLVITSPAALTNASPVPFTLTFSEPVTGLATNRMQITNATSAILNGSGRVYTLSVVPYADQPISVVVPRGAAVDLAGNGCAPASAQVVSDRSRPFAWITTPSQTLVPSVRLTGTSDDYGGTGVAAVSCTWSGATTGSANATGTTSWTLPVVQVNVGQTVFTVSVRDRAGNVGQTTLQLWYQGPRPAEQISGTVPGLDYEYVEGPWTEMPLFLSLDATAVGSSAQIDLSPRRRTTDFGLRFDGYVSVPTTGVYTFFTSSDDGSQMFIGRDQIVFNNGLHGTVERSGSIALQAGLHPIVVEYFQHLGGAALSASYSGPGLAKQVIPATALSRPPGVTGTILREYWSGISGTSVAALTGSTSYPWSPSGSSFLTSFAAPTNWADNYGTRISGHVHVPLTGAYTFWISGDDNCELWISPDAMPYNLTCIATVPGWTPPLVWDKYPAQRSAAITLVAGHSYLIRALQKEGGGGDNLAVGWQLPDGTKEMPIPGHRLSPSIQGVSVVRTPANEPVR